MLLKPRISLNILSVAFPFAPVGAEQVLTWLEEMLVEHGCRSVVGATIRLDAVAYLPEKNLHTRLDAARMAGVPAVLGGEPFPYEEHPRYCDEEIVPRLERYAQLLGAVEGARKQRLLAEARCVLLPTLAPETSSLTAMEALAAGTPVVAYPLGAIPEIVEHGRTGFLVHSVEEMADAIRQIDTIDRDDCRTAAALRFPLERMVAQSMYLYDGRSGRRATHYRQELLGASG